MATAQLDTVIQHLRRVVLLKDGAGFTDGQLLEAFVAQKSEVAFEVLVRRHAGMVMRVCQRVVRNRHDAEDVFQSTFLILARKASGIKHRETLANWLHGVAHRTALKALRAKWQVRERQVTIMPEPLAAPVNDCGELRSIIDHELSHLTEVYRLPVLLCDLEGKSIKEVTQKSLSAAVPSTLIAATIKAAGAYSAGQAVASGLVSANVAVLMKGVIRAMFWTKFKVATVVVILTSAMTVGHGVLRQSQVAGQQIGTASGGRGGVNMKAAAPGGHADTGKKSGDVVMADRDKSPQAELEARYRKLTDAINRAFPESRVLLQRVGNKLAVSGVAKDITDAIQILKIARTEAPKIDETQLPPGVRVPNSSAKEQLGTAGGAHVINLLRIAHMEAGDENVVVDGDAKKIEESLFDRLRGGCLELKKAHCEVWVKEIKGRRLIRPVFIRRDNNGRTDFVAVAKTGDLKVDMPAQEIVITVVELDVISREGDRGTLDTMEFRLECCSVFG